MFSQRTAKRIAIILIQIAVLSAILGFDVISETRLRDTFVSKDAMRDEFYR